MVKGGKDNAEGENADAKYERWKRLLPVLYDSFTNHNLVWPSLSCRWGPRVEDYTYKVKQRAYLSEQTDGSVPNTLVVAHVEVPRPHVAEAESMQSFNYAARSPLVRKYKTIIHPGEVNRIREYPEAQHIVATHSDVPEVYIWNVDTQPERKEDAKVQGSAASQPDLVLTGHVQDAKFAMAFHAKEPRLISGGEDGEVLLWQLEDHISSLASAAPPTEEPTADSGGAGRKSLNSGGLGGLDEDTPGTSTSVKERSRFKGHTDTIEDVVFRPGNADEFCSVGDDKALIFWDARQEGGKPAAKVAAAHSDDIHTVDWNSHSEHLILTGSADHTVRLFDRRKLAREGKDAVVHTFAMHSDAILNVQWCPHRGSVFASGGEDGLVIVWDTDRIAGGANGSVKKKPPPELIFQHAGHRDKVVDFQWNMHDPWTILSVSDDINYAGGGGALQIWRINDLVYLPEEEALGELKRHRDYITGKSNRIADRAQERKATEPPSEGTSEMPKEEGPPGRQEAAAQNENAAAPAGDEGEETPTTGNAQEMAPAKEAAGTAEPEEGTGRGEEEEALEQVEKDEKSTGKEEQASELVAEDERGEEREQAVESKTEDERQGEEKEETVEPIEEDVKEGARQADALEHGEGKGWEVGEAMESVEAVTEDAPQEDVEMTEAPEETQEPKPDDPPGQLAPDGATR